MCEPKLTRIFYFGIVDWGSQSIAQSKFQRAFRLGKEFQQEFFRELRQHIFRKFLFELDAGSPFSAALSHHRLRISASK